MNKIKAVWIITRSVWVTFQTSITVIIRSKFTNATRQHFDKYSRNWARKILNIVKVKYKTVNPHNFSLEPNKQYIIMCNHSSLYDIPITIVALPWSIRMMAKKELFRVPIWGYAMKKSEHISIDREDRKQAVKDLEFAKEKMQSGIIIWIAPEGTRSRTGELLPFKKGAFMLALQTGATIVPIGIRGTKDILPAKTLNFKLNQTVEVHIGQPIDASQYTIRTRAKLMQAIEDNLRIAAGLN